MQRAQPGARHSGGGYGVNDMGSDDKTATAAALLANTRVAAKRGCTQADGV